MKIALYSTQIIESTPDLKGYGALELLVGLLAKYYDDHNHEVHLFAPEGSYQPTGKNSHLYSIGKPAQIHPAEAFKAYWANEQSRKALTEADIVHSHDWGYYPYSVYKELKGKLLHSHHGPDPGFITKPLMEHPNLVAVSFTHAKHLSEMSNCTWRAVHNGIDLSKYPPCKDKEDYLLWISRIYPFKGTDRFISICNKLKQKSIVAGGSFGDVQAYVQQIKDMCAKSDYVDFVGEVDFNRKVELYQKARAVVLPTIEYLPRNDGQGMAQFKEPMGIIGLEANACMTPIIVAPTGGWVESVYHGINGFLSVSDDEFISYIKRIDEIKPENCLKIAKQFSYQHMAKEYLKLYKELIEGDGGW